MEKLLTVEEVANILSLNKNTILRFIKEKSLKAFKVGHQYRIKESDLTEFTKGE